MNEGNLSVGLHASQTTVQYAPGTVVRVTQQIPQRDDVYSIVVSGTVVRQERQESGSWFARNKAGRLWLDRLIIQKADGEKSVLNLDEFTSVEVISGPTPAMGDSPLVLPNADRDSSLT